MNSLTRKSAFALMAAIVAFGAGVTAFHDDAFAGKRSRRNAALGIAAGVATLAIIAAASNSKKSYAKESGYGYNKRANYCQRLLNRCNSGKDWACEKYETGGCTE